MTNLLSESTSSLSWPSARGQVSELLGRAECNTDEFSVDLITALELLNFIASRLNSSTFTLIAADIGKTIVPRVLSLLQRCSDVIRRNGFSLLGALLRLQPSVAVAYLRMNSSSRSSFYACLSEWVQDKSYKRESFFFIHYWWSFRSTN